jgi:hypothetical protein
LIEYEYSLFLYGPSKFLVKEVGTGGNGKAGAAIENILQQEVEKTNESYPY